MKTKIPLLALAILIVRFIVSCDFSPPTIPTLVPSSIPPALPAFVAPSATPTYAPIANLKPGDSITITDGEGKFLWLEYLGNVSGYDHWNCISNAPGKETDCKAIDTEVHVTRFFWDNKVMRNAVAVNTDKGGDIKLYGAWHLTTSAEMPIAP
jgi:hypothetical protein